MRLKLLLTLFVAACLPLLGAQRADSKDQLRKLARLPDLESSFSFAFSPSTGFISLPDKKDAASAMAEIRKSLKGPLRDAESQVKLANLALSLNDRAAAAKHFQKAVDLYRQQREFAQGNAGLLCDLG